MGPEQRALAEAMLSAFGLIRLLDAGIADDARVGAVGMLESASAELLQALSVQGVQLVVPVRDPRESFPGAADDEPDEEASDSQQH